MSFSVTRHYRFPAALWQSWNMCAMHAIARNAESPVDACVKRAMRESLTARARQAIVAPLADWQRAREPARIV
jgi:hypothetical protein